MLTKLSQERVDGLSEIRDKWIKVGLRTQQPGDRDAAWAGVKKAYKIAGLKEPTICIWMDSPFRAVLACGFLASAQVIDQVRAQVYDQVRAQVRAQVRDQVRDQVYDQVSAQVYDQVRDQVSAQVSAQVIDQVRAQVRAQVRDQVRDQVYDQVYAQVRAQVSAQVIDQVYAQVIDQVRAQVRDQVIDQVRAQVYDQVRDQVSAQVRAQVRDQVYDQVSAQVYAQVRAQVSAQVSAQVIDQVRAQVRDQVYDFANCYAIGGLWDAAWISFYESFQTECNFDKIQGLVEVAIHSAMVWTFPSIVVFSASPESSALRDEQNRLHSLTGPAIGFRDGWGVWAVHGVSIPQYVVEHPDQITTQLIDSEQNTEIRRVMIEQYGTDRYLLDSGAKVIHRDRFGVLLRKDIPNDEPICMVMLLNTTPEPGGTMTRDQALEKFLPSTPVCHDGMMMSLDQVPAALKFKVYMEEVPPDMQRAKQAVAWQCDVSEDEYKPAFQS